MVPEAYPVSPALFELQGEGVSFGGACATLLLIHIPKCCLDHGAKCCGGFRDSSTNKAWRAYISASFFKLK